MQEREKTNPPCNFVVELLELGEGAKLGGSIKLNNSINRLEHGDVRKSELLRISAE
jgi:hypothetical protein